MLTLQEVGAGVHEVETVHTFDAQQGVDVGQPFPTKVSLVVQD